jgi:hypothetical protein
VEIGVAATCCWVSFILVGPFWNGAGGPGSGVIVNGWWFRAWERYAEVIDEMEAISLIKF